jgi:4-amino-4-deoxy-L-arabinose transferase-like glycosyltransferase
MDAPSGTLTRPEKLGLVALLVGAAILRFHALDSLPPALYRDVALTAIDALRAAAGHPRLHSVYDEGLYANLMGLGFLLLGPSDWSVRAPGSLFGLLTCWGVWRLGRALEMRRAGLFGAAVLAFSFWHVLLSRSGFRAVLLPCLMVHGIALLVEGVRRGGRWRMAGAGVLLGLGVHVYPSARFAPLALPLYLWVEWRRAPGSRREILRGVAWCAAAAALVALPILLYYARHPDLFLLRHRVVSVLSPGVPADQIAGHLGRNLLSTLLMFHVRGDGNWRHNLSGAPMLDPITGLLVVAGLLVMLRSPRTGGAGPPRAGAAGVPPWPRDRAAAALIVGWLAAMLLPNILSVQGVPHGLRSCAVLPALALLAGAGLEALRGALRRRAGERLAAGAVAVLLGGLACVCAQRYFIAWAGDPRVAEEHDAAYRAAARLLLSAPPGVERLLVGNGGGAPAYGQPAEVWCYLWEMRGRPPLVLGPKDTPRLFLSGRPAYIALVRRDDRVLRLVRELNPGAIVEALSAPGLSAGSPVYRVTPASSAGR